MINEDIQHIIEPELQPGETLLWADRSWKLMLTVNEKYFFGFIIFWLACSALIILPSLMSGQETHEITINGVLTTVSFEEYLLFVSIFPLAGITMLLLGLVLAKLRTGKFYAVTDRRGIIVSTFLGRRVASIFPTQVSSIEVSKKAGLGMIQFHTSNPRLLRLFATPFTLQSFSGIKNPKHVESLIMSLYQKEKTP